MSLPCHFKEKKRQWKRDAFFDSANNYTSFYLKKMSAYLIDNVLIDELAAV